MNDIFISYKRENQPAARILANALEKQGWVVWWDPKLRTGEHFDEAIEKALRDTKCVIVLWSKQSVDSQYVRDEATYALNRQKLVPVAIDNTTLPFRFEGIQTARLSGWDGSDTFPEFEKLLQDLISVLGPPPRSSMKEKLVVKDRNWKEAPRDSTDSAAKGRQQTKKVSSPPEISINQKEHSGSPPAKAPWKLLVIIVAVFGISLLVWFLYYSESPHSEQASIPSIPPTRHSAPPEALSTGAAQSPEKGNTARESEPSAQFEIEPSMMARLAETVKQAASVNLAYALDNIEGEYILTSSTTSPSSEDWKYDKAYLVVQKLEPGYVLMLKACGWYKKPKQACWDTIVIQVRDGKWSVGNANVINALQFSWDPKEITLRSVSWEGTVRIDKYSDATGQNISDSDLIRRMRVARSSWEDSVKNHYYLQYSYSPIQFSISGLE
ncbi:MAG: toll/interleukin-1 receptor domain-containing protein [Methylosarcina sp.]